MFTEPQRRHLAVRIDDAFAKIQAHIDDPQGIELEPAVEEIRCKLVDSLGVSFDLLDSLADERGACWTDEGKAAMEATDFRDNPEFEQAVMDNAAAQAKFRFYADKPCISRADVENAIQVYEAAQN